MSLYNGILEEITNFATTATSLESLQDFVVDIIPSRLPHYNWTGFYMLDPNDAEMLVLGPFRGAPTEHTRIPFTRASAEPPSRKIKRSS